VTEAAASLHREVLRLLKAREAAAADRLCRRLTEAHPEFAAGWVAASHIATLRKDAAGALAAIDRALGVDPANAASLLQRSQILLALHRRGEALAAALAAEQCAPPDAALWGAIGTTRSFANDQAGALADYDRAIALGGADPQLLFNRASVRRFLGDLAGAEADYDQVIALKPADYEAYVNRSDLRVQTPQRNHVGELEALLSGNIADWRGEVQIRFALAKEYEDLGEYAKSFTQLRRGARRRREHLQYDVATDVATVEWIIEAFPGGPAAPAAGAAQESPIFIVGLPRSGTTLVERILGSHSQITPAGELDSFALALVDAARARSGGAQLPRRELVAASAGVDFAALGADYLRRAHAAFGGGGRFTDKMPLNYLYCGLIHRALPNARIVHVTRQPMAVGYAIYKTLFKNGYPFSYDLEEIGRYYGAYRRLMQHWQRSMPGVIHELRYEDLVADSDAETRRLLAYCGLDWEAGCAEFHRNPAATTTASASQVRRPIYRSSIAQWQHYETELAPLKQALAAAGIGL
jgi:tetratricopeptide (TPR) repeat protein